MEKIGSHNSLSYLPPKNFLLYPFRFMARCQRVSYKEQYEKYEVRMFDLRVWYTDFGELIIRHGLLTYKISSQGIDDFLEYLNEKGDCLCRVILEELVIDQKPDFEYFFKIRCDTWKKKYQRIKFFGGERKYDWKKIYTGFGDWEPEIIDRYSSTTSLFKSKNKFLKVIDDLWPWLYAKIWNKRNYELKLKENEWLLIDFVDEK